MHATNYPNINISPAKMARAVALGFIVAISLFVVIGSPVESRAAAQSCPDFSNARTVGELARFDLNEASGLVASRTHSNRYWLHNDSGDSARIFAMTRAGEDRGVVKLGSRPSADFEDIAIGPGPNASKDYIYVGDIGNNGHGRATVRIYRFPEPTPPGKGNTITIPDSQIETFVYGYQQPGDPSKTWRRNAESLIVDPRSGDVIIFEKQLSTIGGNSNMAWVYRIKQNELEEGRTIKAKPMVAVKARRDSSYGPLTGADISVDGRLIIAKNGGETFSWLRGSGQTVYQALDAHPVTSCLAPRTPGEAIAIHRNGKSYISVTEKRHAPVWQVDVDYDGATPPPPSGPSCNGKAATIVGTQGDDVIEGTSERDVIVGLGGDDVIRGRAGRDTICGGDGKDTIYGNRGDDKLYGNEAGDRIYGGGGEDFILGAKGFDKMFGNRHDDYIAGAAGNDKLVGGAGNDELMAGVGTDECIGGSGNDDYQSCE